MINGRVFAECTNENCTQFGKIKSISMVYLGDGVYQRVTPVCSSCDGIRDMKIVTPVESK